jgi:ketosteroid isomerase-like protein
MTLQSKSGKPTHDVGKYLTVWKRQPDGSYKAIRDINNSDGPTK